MAHILAKQVILTNPTNILHRARQFLMDWIGILGWGQGWSDRTAIIIYQNGGGDGMNSEMQSWVIGHVIPWMHRFGRLA